MAEDKRIDVVFGANVKGLFDGAAQAGNIVKETTEGMASQFEGLATAAEGVLAPFAAIGALLAGGALFKEAVEKTVDLGVELNKTSKITGVSVEDLSRLKYASEQLAVPFDAVEHGLQKLSRSAYQAANGSAQQAQAFKELGISVTDQDGKLRPTNELFKDVAERLSKIHNPTLRQAEAMNLLGRSGAQLLPVLMEGKDGLQKLGDESDRVGATMSGEQAEAAEKYEQSMKRLHASVDGLWRSIGGAVIGPLSDLADSLVTLTTYGNDTAKSMKNAEGATSFFGDAIKLVTQATITFEGQIAEGMTTVEGGWNALTSAVTTYGTVQDLVLQGRFKDAVNAGKQGFQDLKDISQGTTDQIQQQWDAVDAKIQAIYDGKHKASTEKGGDGGDDPDTGKDKKAKDPLKEWTAQWERMRATVVAEGGKLKDIDADVEYAFWQSKLSIAKVGSDDWTKIELKLGEIQKKMDAESEKADKSAEAAAKKRQDAQKKASELMEQDEANAVKQRIELERIKVEELYTMGQINAQQRLAQLTALDKQEQVLELQALQRKLALAKGDVVQQQTIMNQIAAMKRANELKEAKDEQAAINATVQRYKQLGSQLQGVFRNIGQEIMNGASAMDIMRNEGKQVFGDLISMGAEYVSKLIMNALVAKTTSKTSAAGEITANASVAATAGMASVAAIPIVGWAMAPGVGAALEAEGLGYLAGLSAKGGFDIPAGLNPIVQTHAREMILPEKHADTIRQLGDSGGGGGSLHLTVRAMDSQDVSRFLRRNAPALAAGIRNANRNGFLRR